MQRVVLEISILGEQRVAEDGEVLAAVHAPRSLALLAYLALHRGAPQPRHHVAGLFWPDSTEAQARTNLRRELHHLRASLPAADEVLAVDGTTLLWRDDARCRLDVARFEEAADRAAEAAAAGRTEESVAAAREAASCYGGDLLPALYDDWVVEERERLHRRCLRLLDDLVAAQHAAGDLASAIGYARRRVELEPLEEAGYRSLLELQAQAGDRAAAIRSYHRCVSVLDRELGVAPDPATTAAYRRLLSTRAIPQPRRPVGAEAADDTATGGDADPLLHGRIPLVGRSRELAALTAAWHVACSGMARIAVVSGEAGVGKSRLVEEAVAAARGEAAAAGWARCFAGEGRPPLAPVSDWLRSAGLRAAVDRLDPALRVEVERLVVPTPARASTSSPDRASEPEGWRPLADAWQRHRFFDGLARATLAVGGPTLLVLDDVQWCDEETLAWLQTLLRVGESAPLLVVMTARTEELADNAGVSGALRALRAADVATDVELAPLDESGTAALAAHLAVEPPAPTVTAWLHSLTAGNPLFVIEAMRGTDVGAARSPDIARLPRVHAVLGRRLTPLGDAAREIAGLAAATGSDFSVDLLVHASDLDAEEVVEALDELWRRRIVHERAVGTYDFVHDLLRDVAYAELSPARRRLAHRRIAQSMELLRADAPETVAAVAEQYDLAGEAERAVRFHVLAAEAATAVFANERAVRHYRRAVDLLARQPPDPTRDGTELAVRYAMSGPLNALYGYSSPEIQQTLERACDLAERQGRSRMHLLSLLGLWAVRFVQGHTAESYRLATRAHELSTEHPDLLGHTLMALGGTEVSLGRPGDGHAHLAEVRALTMDAESLPFGVRPEVHGHGWSAHALALLGRTDEAQAASEWAVERAKAAGHPYSIVVGLAYGAVTAQVCGDRSTAADLARALRALCARYGYVYYSEWGVVVEGWAIGGAEGAEAIRGALATLRRLSAYTRHPYYLGLLAETLLDAGEETAAEATLSAAETSALAHDDEWWLPELWRLHARLRPAAERAAWLDRAADLARRQGAALLLRRVEEDRAGQRTARATAPTPR